MTQEPLSTVIERLEKQNFKAKEYYELNGISVDTYCTSADLSRLIAAHRKAIELIEVLVENDPGDSIADGGHTVLDLWRHDARRALSSYRKEGEAN